MTDDGEKTGQMELKIFFQRRIFTALVKKTDESCGFKEPHEPYIKMSGKGILDKRCYSCIANAYFAVYILVCIKIMKLHASG